MNTQLPARMVSESKPVRVLGTVLAVLVALQGYVSTIDAVPTWAKLVLGGAILLTTVGLARWTQSQVTPWEAVAAKVTPDGQIVSGPADPGRPNGAAVSVVADPSGGHAVPEGDLL